jgi:hypothetical protein
MAWPDVIMAYFALKIHIKDRHAGIPNTQNNVSHITAKINEGIHQANLLTSMFNLAYLS